MNKNLIEREKTFNKKEYDKEYRKKNYRQFAVNISIDFYEQIEKLDKKNEIPLKVHVLNIFFIALISNLLAYFLKNVQFLLQIIISVIGGVCSGVIEYVVPGILYLTVENKMAKNNKMLTAILMLWMMLLGLSITICGIIFSVSPKK